MFESIYLDAERVFVSWNNHLWSIQIGVQTYWLNWIKGSQPLQIKHSSEDISKYSSNNWASRKWGSLMFKT